MLNTHVVAKSSQDAKSIRRQLATQHERDLQVKQNEWNEKYRSVVENRDDLDKKLQDQKALNLKLTEETSSAKRKLDDLKVSLSNERKEKEILEEKLNNSVREKKLASDDVLRLKEQLKSKDDDIQVRDRDLKSLQQQIEALRNDKISLKRSIELLKSEVDGHLTTIKNLQDEYQNQASEREKNLRKALDSTKQELATITGEKGCLEKELQEARTDANDSAVAAETRFNHEKERFQQDLRQLKDAKKADEQALTDKINDNAEHVAAEAARLGDELSSVKRQVDEALASLKKSEGERKKIQEQAAKDLETHKQIAAQKMEEKLKEEVEAMRSKLEQKKKQEVDEIRRQLTAEARQQGQHKREDKVPRSRFSQQSTEELAAIATQTLSSRDTRSRRKINRHEQSNRPSAVLASSNQPVVISSDSTGHTYPNRLGDLEHLDEAGVMLRQFQAVPVAEKQLSTHARQSQATNSFIVSETLNTVIPETQNTMVPETQDFAAHDMLFRSTTSDLTSPPKTSSPKTLRLLNERGLVTPTGRDPRGYQHEGKGNVNGPGSTGFVSDGRAHHLESPVHPRPTSQANTGSRMAPAPGTSVYDNDQPSKAQFSPVPPEFTSKRHTHAFSGHDVSIQAPSSSSKPPKLRINLPKTDSNGSRAADNRGSMLPPSIEASRHKRKEAPSRAVHETPKRIKETPSNPPSSVSHARAPSVARSGRVQTYGQGRGSSHSGATSVTRQGSGPRRKSRLLCLSVWG